MKRFLSFIFLIMSIASIITGIRTYKLQPANVMQITKSEGKLKNQEIENEILKRVENDLEYEPDTTENILYKETKTDDSDKSNEDTDLSLQENEIKFPYYIMVNKEMNTITIYGLDEDNNYSVPVKAMICSTGKATPIGIFKTSDKYTWKLLKGNVWGQYSTRITDHILFHSVPNSRKAKDSLIAKYYNKLGTTASAGCVRLTVEDAKWLIDNCPSGTNVEIYKDENPGPLGKPVSIIVPGGTKWDPTDPDPDNPWLDETAVITGVKDYTVEQNEGVNPLDGVIALDRFGNDITNWIVVSGGVDTTTPGTYEITYEVTDVMGSTVIETAVYTVIEEDDIVY